MDVFYQSQEKATTLRQSIALSMEQTMTEEKRLGGCSLNQIPKPEYPRPEKERLAEPEWRMEFPPVSGGRGNRRKGICGT